MKVERKVCVDVDHLAFFRTDDGGKTVLELLVVDHGGLWVWECMWDERRAFIWLFGASAEESRGGGTDLIVWTVTEATAGEEKGKHAFSCKLMR